MKALQLLNMVLNPSLVPKNSTIESYGCDAMKEIVGHYRVKMVLLIQNRRLSQLFFSVCQRHNVSLDLVYKFKKIRGVTDFSDQLRKNLMRYKRIGYNLNVMGQSAC